MAKDNRSLDDDIISEFLNESEDKAPLRITVKPKKQPSAQDSDPGEYAIVKEFLNAPENEEKPAQSLPTEKTQVLNEKGVLSNSSNENAVSGALKGAATGAIRGLGNAVGFAQNANNLVDYLTSRAESKITGRSLDEINAKRAEQDAALKADTSTLGRIRNATNPLNVLPKPEDISGPILNKTGEYEPTSALGRAAQSGVEAVTTAFGPGGVGARLANPMGVAARLPVTGATMPAFGNAVGTVARAIPDIALGGGAAQAVTEATGDPLWGMAAGIAAPAAVGRVRNALGGSVDPERAAVAQRARDLGIPLGAGDISTNQALRFFSDVANKFPMAGGERYSAAKQAGFNRAIAREMGDNANAVTPEVMARTRTRLGQGFDSYKNGSPLNADQALQNDLIRIGREASQVVAQSELEPIVTQMRNIAAKVDPQNSTIAREAYHNIIKKGAPLDRAMHSNDSNIKFYAGQIRDALDGALERSMPAHEVADFRKLRYQYKVMKTIEDLVEKSPDGNLSPALLMGAVRKNFEGMAYTGAGNMGDIARAGQMMKAPPNSGTPERLMYMNWLSGPGKVSTTDIANYAIPAAVGATVGRLFNKTLNSNFLTNRMIGVGTGQTPGAINLLTRALPQGPAFATMPGIQAWPLNPTVPQTQNNALSNR